MIRAIHDDLERWVHSVSTQLGDVQLDAIEEILARLAATTEGRPTCPVCGRIPAPAAPEEDSR